MKLLTMHTSTSSSSAGLQDGWAPAHHSGQVSLPDPLVALVPGISSLPPVALMEDSLCLPEKAVAPQNGSIGRSSAHQGSRLIVGEANLVLSAERSSPNGHYAPARRLVVLVPAEEIAVSHLARRVWQLAACSRLRVLYLALSPKDQWVGSQHRRLAELAALTNDKSVQARGKVSEKMDWRQAVENVLEPGDLLVCLAGHQINKRINRSVGLGGLLADALHLPIYLLGDVPLAEKRSNPRIKEILGWIISIALMAGFFVLQLNIQRTVLKPLATLFLCLSIVLEIYLLAKVNEWIG